MLVPFDTLPKQSRIWIYQSNKPFTAAQEVSIAERIEAFVATWRKHGEDLRASYIIKYNHFIILAVDESFKEVSGCSIDSSVHLIQQLEKDLNTDLMNKMLTAFKAGGNINIVSLAEFQNFVKEGKINSDTVVYNNMVQSIEEYESKWEVKAIDSWHKRFFGTVIS